jgi:hypothetical protein
MQNGGKIQNGAQNTKNLILLPNGRFSTDLKKTFVRFVCRPSIYKYPLSLLKKSPRWRRKSMKSNFVKKIDFYKAICNLRDTRNFYYRQSAKCCPRIPNIPSVFVKGYISK